MSAKRTTEVLLIVPLLILLSMLGQGGSSDSPAVNVTPQVPQTPGGVAASPYLHQGLGVRLIACGDHCSFLVDAQGSLYSRGQGTYGPLGAGNTLGQLEPVRVHGY